MSGGPSQQELAEALLATIYRYASQYDAQHRPGLARDDVAPICGTLGAMIGRMVGSAYPEATDADFTDIIIKINSSMWSNIRACQREFRAASRASAPAAKRPARAKAR